MKSFISLPMRSGPYYGGRALVGQFVRVNPDGSRSDLSERVNYDRSRQRDAERKARKAAETPR